MRGSVCVYVLCAVFSMVLIYCVLFQCLWTEERETDDLEVRYVMSVFFYTVDCRMTLTFCTDRSPFNLLIYFLSNSTALKSFFYFFIFTKNWLSEFILPLTLASFVRIKIKNNVHHICYFATKVCL